MGGVVIIGAVVFSALLWGMISDRKLVVFILATLALATLGFVDDFIKLKYLRQERDGVKRKTKIIVQAIISAVAIYALYKTHGTVTMKMFLPCFKTSLFLNFSTRIISKKVLLYAAVPLSSVSVLFTALLCES